jgi:hypothetical protein
MKYWVIKANPKRYRYEGHLRPGKEENWHSKRPPADIQSGDRLFLWESGPLRRVVGFGEVVKPVSHSDEEGLRMFRVRYLTHRLEWMPGIDLLKTNLKLKYATFVNRGIPQTVYPLDHVQAEELYRIVVAGNPADHIWRDILGASGLPDIEASAIEGSSKLVTHLRRERNPELAKKKKTQFQTIHRRLFCEACQCEHNHYGDLTGDIFEVHHRLPLSKASGPVKTRLQDLTVLCPNCHRAIHRTEPMISVAALAKRLSRNLPLK